jgi:hypothetical protein
LITPKPSSTPLSKVTGGPEAGTDGGEEGVETLARLGDSFTVTTTATAGEGVSACLPLAPFLPLALAFSGVFGDDTTAPPPSDPVLTDDDSTDPAGPTVESIAVITARGCFVLSPFLPLARVFSSVLGDDTTAPPPSDPDSSEETTKAGPSVEGDVTTEASPAADDGDIILPGPPARRVRWPA